MNTTAELSKLRELIKDIQFAMLTTTDAEGNLHSRPMATQQTELDGDLWFFTRTDSPLAQELTHQQRINASYADPVHHNYVSVSGHARLVQDRVKAAELWNPLYKTWFPEGLEDPQLVLVQVEIEQAEYWDRAANRMATLKNFIRSISGRSARPQSGGKKLDIAS